MVSQVTEEKFEGVEIMPQERVQNRKVEQFVDVPVPKSHEQIVEAIPVKQVVKSFPTFQWYEPWTESLSRSSTFKQHR